MSSPEKTDGPMDEIVPGSPLELPRGKAIREFKPWHLPRKQHVRLEQWAGNLRGLIPYLSPQTPIKYLGLPAQDMLDLEVLAEVCGDLNRSLGYLGFDETALPPEHSAPRQVAEQIVRSKVSVLQGSGVREHSFAAIGTPDSAAQRIFREFGSYDVVNLDLCGAFTSHETSGQMHNAIAELFRHQRNGRTQPWLLYLTLRSESNKMSSSERERYLALLAANCRKSEIFTSCVYSVAALSSQGTEDCASALGRAMKSDCWVSGRLTAVALGKWFAQLLGGNTPWRVELASLWGYRTGLLDKNGVERAKMPPNMMSLVFRFQRTTEAVTDPHGLAPAFAADRGAPSVQHDLERILAEQMAACARSHAKDLDRELRNNKELLASLQSSSKRALGNRDYVADEYDQFVQSAASVPCDEIIV